jgi:single-strand DNA-binding protein
MLKNSLAVKREFKKDETDFINIVAWGKTAELIAKYTQKGSKLYIEGSLQIGSYEDKEGKKRQTADVIVRNIEFIGGNKQNKESDFLGDPVEQEPLPF